MHSAGPGEGMVEAIATKRAGMQMGLFGVGTFCTAASNIEWDADLLSGWQDNKVFLGLCPGLEPSMKVMDFMAPWCSLMACLHSAQMRQQGGKKDFLSPF